MVTVLGNWRPSLPAMAWMALVALAVSTAWPAALGGSSRWLITSGISMEPGISRGDLVLVRAADEFAVGDVAAYHSRELGRTVLHRIKSHRGNKLVFQGDNNDFLDPSPVEMGDVEGTMRMALPAALWTPIVIGMLVLLTGSLVFSRPKASMKSHPTSNALTSIGRALLGASVLALIVISQLPPHAAATPPVPTAMGTLSYAAPMQAGATYPKGVATDGEPIYTRLGSRMRLTYRYSAPPSAALAVRSTKFVAVVSDANGLEQEIDIASAERHAGNDVVLEGKLDIAQLERLLAHIQEETGVVTGALTVNVTPSIVSERRGGSPGAAPIRHEAVFSFVLTAGMLKPPSNLAHRDKATEPNTSAARPMIGLAGIELPRIWAQYAALVMIVVTSVMWFCGSMLGGRFDELECIDLTAEEPPVDDLRPPAAA